MRTRVITGVVAAVLFLGVMIQPYTIVLHIVVAVLCAIASYELLCVTGFCPSKIVQIVSMAFAATVPFWGYFLRHELYFWPLAFVLVYAIVIGIVQIYRFDEQPITSSIYAVAMTLWSSIALSAIAFVRSVDGHGLFLIILMLLSIWMSDTGAYFTGVLFGSHKLCPEISPKKTVEGLIGGIVTALIVCGVATYIYNLTWRNYYTTISLGWMTLICVICAVLSVFGDLTASLLKRLCDIKDYGNLFPGHGGVMDRFDGFLFSAPVFVFSICAFKDALFISTIACL